MKKRILAILMAAIMCCLQLAEFVPAEKVKAAYSVSEEDIYYRCPEYLDNKAYDNYMARCEERIEKGMSTINDAEGLGASILYSLQNGADIIISELASKAGIGQSTKDKLNKEVVYQLIQAYLSSDTSATNTVSQIGNAYSTISDAYNVANATDLYNYKVSLKNSSLNLSDNQVDKLVDMYTDADTFSKILGYAGNVQKALKIITAYIEMQDLDLAVLNKLDDAFSSMDSEFASAIRSIMSDRTSDFLTFAKKNYLQDEVIKKMVSAVAKYGSSPVVFVKNVCANILGKIYKSFCPTADQIIQAGMCQAYTYLARNKVNKIRKEFKNGKASEDKIEQYKVAYGFYITTMKTTMNKVAGCVNGSDKSIKQALKSWAGSLSGFTYATYMDRCRSEASADVSAGLLKISGNTVTRKTPNGTTIDGNYDSTESIKARLAAIKQKYPPNQGVTWKGDWGGATQCFGFARMVFFFLYGKEMPARYYSNARYQYRDERENDEEVLLAMQSGTLEWQSGVAERFSKKIIDSVNERMNLASDRFQQAISKSHGEEGAIIYAILALRKEMAFLAETMNLPVLPDKDRQTYINLVLEQADKMQETLEKSASNEKSGKMRSIIRNNRINIDRRKTLNE